MKILNNLSNEKYSFFLVFSFAAVLMSLAQESSSSDDCGAYAKIIDGFDNAFEGLYSMSTEEMSDGNYEYKLITVPSAFEEGTITLNPSKQALKVFMSSYVIGTVDEVEKILKMIDNCLTSYGFTYDEFGDDYDIGSYDTVYYYYNSKLEISIVESWLDDAMIFMYFDLKD